MKRAMFSHVVWLTILAAGLCMIVSLVACTSNETSDANTGASDSSDENNSTANTGSNASVDRGSDDSNNVIVEITMEDGGIIRVELDSSAAPITVQNFVGLVNENFYDGLTFHRVIPNFMIQGGDPLGTGTGGSDQTIKGEFSKNGVENPISHTRGTISMARSDDYDSASSQFFITNADATNLDGSYAAFGRVIEGMDEVDRISAVETDGRDKPLEPVVIKSVRIIKA